MELSFESQPAGTWLVHHAGGEDGHIHPRNQSRGPVEYVWRDYTAKELRRIAGKLDRETRRRQQQDDGRRPNVGYYNY